MSAGRGPAFRCSVIVPCWNDWETLAVLLPRLRKLEKIYEIIVVDASSDRACETLAARWGAVYLHSAKPSRGEQMNIGAAAAIGEVLLFNHADTELTATHLSAMEEVMSDPAVVGGAFFRKFDRRHPHLDWLAKIARIHNRWGTTIFGDQSIFVRREIFHALGGFAQIPLMEDVEFSKRLRSAGPIAIIDPPVESSARRHMTRGPWRTSLLNVLLLLLYKIGVPPRKLHSWYYRGRESTAAPIEFGSELAPVK